jgi:hypothetical protein
VDQEHSQEASQERRNDAPDFIVRGVADALARSERRPDAGIRISGKRVLQRHVQERHVQEGSDELTGTRADGHTRRGGGYPAGGYR